MPTPSKRTPEVEERILTALRGGTPLAAVCREVGITDETWRNWCEADQALAFAYARARDEGFDRIALDALEIVDAPPERYMTEMGERIDPASVAWAKNRAEQRLKLLAKWDPRRYGDKVALTGGSPDDAPIRTAATLDVSGLSAETLREIAAMRVEKG